MLRRVLWLIPTLFLVSLAAFQFLAWTLPTQPLPHRGELPRSPLPVFLNLRPDNARELAQRLTRSVAEGNDPQAARHLVVLGGAGLPFVLPHLDELSPTERGRVALALKPLALRMGIATNLELGDPDTASLFWTRFWQDRALDFRPTVVRRLVKRLTERSLALRRDDVIQLDTYALPELIKALGRVKDHADIERVRRLGLLLAHITEKDWQLEATPSLVDAQRSVLVWQAWWLAEGASYVALDGISKATATVTQTRYGRWLFSLPLEFGTRHDRSTLSGTLPGATLLTLLLLSSGVVGGYGLGLFAAVTGTASRGRLPQVFGIAAFLGLLVPCLVAAVDPADAGKRGLFAACCAMVAFGFGAAYLYQRASTLTKSSAPWWPEGSITGVRALAVMAESAAPAVGLFGASLPALVLAATILEAAFGVPGLGQLTVAAVRQGDTEWLMAIALVSTTLTALLQMLSDSAAVALGYRRSARAGHEKLVGVR